MTAIIQQVVLPIAGLALIGLAWRWVARTYRPKPKRRHIHDTGPSKADKIRKDWGL